MLRLLRLTTAVLAIPAIAQADDFEDRVRTFLLENPEVILEALTILSEREARAATIAKLDAFPELFDDAARLGNGNDAAPLRVVKFFDYRCVPCKTVHPELVDFVYENPQVRIEMRHLPILSPGSERAARFALATQVAYGDTAYEAVHNELWDLQGPLNTRGFQRISTQLDLDFTKIEAVMGSDEVTQRINYNRDAAIALEVLGTPAFVTKNSVAFGSTDVKALSQTWLNQ